MSAQASARPDIVLILTDEERAAPSYENDALARWRHDHLPARRWFAEHGVGFDRHYVAATACVPSRPSLLTGQYPDVHGVTQTDGLGKSADDTRMRWLRPDEVPTMGHWFRAAGYDTHYDGKWHVSHADLVDRSGDGDRPLATNTSDGTVIPEAVQAYLDADPLDEYGFTGWVGPEPHGGSVRNTGFIRDPLIADRVVDWLADRYDRRAAGDAAAQRPFLLVCSFVNPHDIVLWPLLMRRNFLSPSLAEPPAVPPSPTDDEDLSSKPAVQMSYRDAYYSAYGPNLLVRRAYRRNLDEYRRTYLRLHHDVDGPIDRVRRAVSAGGSDAVMVLSSDHGDQLGSHGGLHQKWYQLYDESTRVPFHVARIGTRATTGGMADVGPTSHVDLLPTLLGFAGTSAEDLRGELEDRFSELHPLPGRDLSGVVDGTGNVAPAPVYLMTRDNMLEGDGSASAVARENGRTDVPFPLQIRLPAHVGTNFEAVVAPVADAVDGVGHVWKIVRTFDDPAVWTEPGERQLSARLPGGSMYRDEPIPDQWELYDLDADPIEAVNRWRDPDAEPVRAHLVALLADVAAARVPARHEEWAYAVRPSEEKA